MLSKNQEKLIRSLDTKKGRRESGFCLVEGEKNIVEAQGFIDFTFTPSDTDDFASLVETVTPQPTAAVARIPVHSLEQLMTKDVIVVLDGVQDPGNVGTILRLCLGFNAGLLLIESADPSSPKVVRSSAGAFFKTIWHEVKREEAASVIEKLQRDVYRLEKRPGALEFSLKTLEKLPKKLTLIAGSEGQGIKLEADGQSLMIPHAPALESLNVATTLAIVLAGIFGK